MTLLFSTGIVSRQTLMAVVTLSLISDYNPLPVNNHHGGGIAVVRAADEENNWLMDRKQLLDIDDVRLSMIDNITQSFLNLTKKVVMANRLLLETRRRLLFLNDEINEVSYDAKWALMSWFAAMFLLPVIEVGIIGIIISLFFQTELTNLQILLHTRWDVGDQPEIITESKAKQRLGNLAMQRLYRRMSRHPQKNLPKQAERNPEALVHEKPERPEPPEPDDNK